MRWFLTGPGPASSGHATPPDSASCSEKTESIRAAMVASLNGSTMPNARTLMLRIQYAASAEHLWYLRPEAMSVLASLRGEAQAREALARISPLFQDLLPEGLASQLRAAGAANSPMFSRRRDTLKETA